MKRKYLLIVLVLILSFSLVSCNKNVELNDKTNDKSDDKSKENKAISQVGEDYFKDSDIAALILNDLSSEKIEEYKKNIDIEEYGDSSYESSLIIPKYNDMKISVYTADYTEDKLIKAELLYVSKNKENYGFLLRKERPEGMPLIITIEGNDFNEEYFYAYNGKDGNAEYELIRKNNTNTDVN